MAEFGIVVPQGRRHIGELIALTVGEDDAVLPALARRALCEIAAALEALDCRIDKAEAAILGWHKGNATSRSLAAIPGIGPITASALVATVGDARQFGSARQFAAWLGLVPKQNSSGGKQRQGGISKQGDRYLRRLLVVGPTAVIRFARGPAGATPSAIWSRALLERRPTLLDDLLAGSSARGDPMSPLRWTCKSLSRLTSALLAQGPRIGRTWSASCCTSKSSACKQTARPVKVTATRIGMHSSDRAAARPQGSLAASAMRGVLAMSTGGPAVRLGVGELKARLEALGNDLIRGLARCW